MGPQAQLRPLDLLEVIPREVDVLSYDGRGGTGTGEGSGEGRLEGLPVTRHRPERPSTGVVKEDSRGEGDSGGGVGSRWNEGTRRVGDGPTFRGRRPREGRRRVEGRRGSGDPDEKVATRLRSFGLPTLRPRW